MLPRQLICSVKATVSVFVIIVIIFSSWAFLSSTRLRLDPRLGTVGRTPFKQASVHEASFASVHGDQKIKDYEHDRENLGRNCSSFIVPLSTQEKNYINDTFKKITSPPHGPRQYKELHFRDNSSQILTLQNVEFGPDNVSDGAKYLIYRCDFDRSCGGWADRIKGILFGYVIANLTGRVFKIEILKPPCDIQQVLEPNQVNWKLPVSFHKVVNPDKDPDVKIWSVVDDVNFHKTVRTLDFRRQQHMNAKYIYFKSNLDFMAELKNSKPHEKELSWMKDLTRDQINAAIFKRLFKLSSKLHGKLCHFFSTHLNSSDKLVCAHVRTGRNPSIPNDSVVRVKTEHLSKIWTLLHNLLGGVKNYKVFLMSDSEKVIANARRQSFGGRIITTGGQIVHLDVTRTLSNAALCAGLEKVVLDQFILMHCDALVISKSGLGRMAAYIRGSDQGLYCTLLDGRVIPCQKSKLQEVYNIYG